MSAPGDVKDSEIEVKLGDQVLGTATLDNTISAAVYDQNGTAHHHPARARAGPRARRSGRVRIRAREDRGSRDPVVD